MITEQELTLGSLDELDGGKIGRLVKNHLRRAADDCYDRPSDDRARKVTIEIELVPIDDGHGSAESVKTRVKCVCKVPHHQSRPYEMRIANRGSGLLFNSGAPDNLAQHTMAFEGDDGDDE